MKIDTLIKKAENKISRRKIMKTLQEKAELDRIQQLTERLETWGDVTEGEYEIWQLLRFKSLPEMLKSHQKLTNNPFLETVDTMKWTSKMAALPTDGYDGFIHEGWTGSDPFLELREAGIELPQWTLEYLD